MKKVSATITPGAIVNGRFVPRRANAPKRPEERDEYQGDEGSDLRYQIEEKYKGYPWEWNNGQISSTRAGAAHELKKAREHYKQNKRDYGDEYEIPKLRVVLYKYSTKTGGFERSRIV